MKKRKLTHLMLIALIILTVVAFSACGEAPPQGVTWSFDEATGILTISGNGPMSNYSLTEVQGGKGNYYVPNTPWYNEREAINRVIIKEGVTSIGDCAFCDLENLTSVEIPNSITSVGGEAFSGCDNLQIKFEEWGGYLGNNDNPYVVLVVVDPSITSATLPESTKVIYQEAFYGCNALENIEIPDGITNVGAGAFENCRSLQYNEKDGVKYLGNKNNPYIIAMTADKTIISVTLPETVKAIYYKAFSRCNELSSISIPDGTIDIGVKAFEMCLGLTSIEIPNSVANIGGGAFGYCGNLGSVKLLGDLKSIGGGTFYYCYMLETLIIPDGVTSIGEDAFRLCTGLRSIDIPSSVTNMGVMAFSECDSLTTINYNGTKSQWENIQGVGNAYINSGCTIHCADGDIVIE